MKITEIQIAPIKSQNGLVAFASVVINDSLYLGSIGIHSKIGGGYRLTYPTKQAGGKSFNLFYPINRDASGAIEHAIISKFIEVMKFNYDRHNSFNN